MNITDRGVFLEWLTKASGMTHDIFSAFTGVGFQRDEALQLTMQLIDRIEVEDE